MVSIKPWTGLNLLSFKCQTLFFLLSIYVSTCLYLSVLVCICQYLSCTSQCIYVIICTSQYLSIFVSTSQYLSVLVSILCLNWVRPVQLAGSELTAVILWWGVGNILCHEVWEWHLLQDLLWPIDVGRTDDLPKTQELMIDKKTRAVERGGCHQNWRPTYNWI